MKILKTVGFIFVLVLGIASMFGSQNRVIRPKLPQPDAGDWGDAPDPNTGMDTGYYAPFPAAPGVFIYDNAGIAAQFPTDTDGIQGPYTSDVDDFWIGPLLSAPVAVDIPSVESGVYDPADPDVAIQSRSLTPFHYSK